MASPSPTKADGRPGGDGDVVDAVDGLALDEQRPLRNSSLTELERYFRYERSPREFIERRTEEISFVNDHFYRVNVMQQFKIPTLSEDGADAAERDMFVPLGRFSKVRMPDLRVARDDGTLLPVLDRRERANLVAAAYLGAYEDTFLDSVGTDAPEEAQAIWSAVIGRLVEEIIEVTPADAWSRITTLGKTLDSVAKNSHLHERTRLAAANLRADDSFWADLATLADVTPLVGLLRGAPGRTYVITIEFREWFGYESDSAREARRTLSRMRRLLLWLRDSVSWRRCLSYLGLVAVSIYREVANASYARSIWIVVSPPDEIEPVRFYWQDRREEAIDHESAAAQSDRAVVGRYNDSEEEVLTQAGVALDLQLRPNATYASALLLTVFLWIYADFLYKRIPELASNYNVRSSIIALASIFAAVPAALMGAVAFRGQAFTRRMSRAPRAILLVVVVEAATLAATLALKDLWEATLWMSLTLSVSAFAATGYLLLVQWAPRFRKNGRSRIHYRTSKKSPRQCQRGQRIWTSVLFLALLVLTFIVAYVEYNTRNTHLFFTSHTFTKLGRALEHFPH